jgi:hypothetical protein
MIRPPKPRRVADIEAPLIDVRFTPKSGHCRATVRCPLCAISGHMRRSKISLVDDLEARINGTS